MVHGYAQCQVSPLGEMFNLFAPNTARCRDELFDDPASQLACGYCLFRPRPDFCRSAQGVPARQVGVAVRHQGGVASRLCRVLIRLVIGHGIRDCAHHHGEPVDFPWANQQHLLDRVHHCFDHCRLCWLLDHLAHRNIATRSQNRIS